MFRIRLRESRTKPAAKLPQLAIINNPIKSSSDDFKATIAKQRPIQSPRQMPPKGPIGASLLDNVNNLLKSILIK